MDDETEQPFPPGEARNMLRVPCREDCRHSRGLHGSHTDVKGRAMVCENGRHPVHYIDVLEVALCRLGDIRESQTAESPTPSKRYGMMLGPPLAGNRRLCSPQPGRESGPWTVYMTVHLLESEFPPSVHLCRTGAGLGV